MKKQRTLSSVFVICMLVMMLFGIQTFANTESFTGDGGFIDIDELFPEIEQDKCVVTVIHKTVDGVVFESWNEKGYEGEEYFIAARSYKGYSVVSIPDNASGVFSSENTTVTFVYDNVTYDYSLDKNGINFGRIDTSCVLFAASYKEEVLSDACFTYIDTQNAGTDISYNELGLEIDNSDTVRAFILSDTESLKPLALHRVYELSEKRDAYSFVRSSGDYTNSLANNTNFIRENIKSGWTYDNRGGRPLVSVERPVTSVEDISNSEGTAFIREFNRIDSDVIKADYIFKAKGNGVYTEFRDEHGNSTYQIKLLDDAWCILTPYGEYEAIYENNSDSFTTNKFRVFLDFSTGKSKTYINGEYCGEHQLLSDNTVNFRFATDEDSKGAYTPMQTEFTANYVIYETFDNYGIDSIFGWESKGNVSVSKGEVVLLDKASLKNNFSRPVKAKFAAETYVYRSKCEDMALTLSSGNNTVFELKASKGKLLANGIHVYDLTDDMWYRLRIVSDPARGKATVYLNGRVIAEQILYTTDAVDSYTISSESGKTVYDNIRVFELAEHEDYVPAPHTKANLDDYIVFINVCSLWNNDEHRGWACITPYEELKPVLGYYDEGNPETAVWEINYLVNHGIDVQVFCWYNMYSKGALKDSGNSAQLHDGYMYSKYGDYMKYVIMLETSAKSFDSQQFRNYVIPYWFENYFLDDRYLKIDNKIVLHSWYAGRLSEAHYFGSVEAAKEEMDYLNDVAKSYGFDGVILTCADKAESTAYQFGFEAKGAYHWSGYYSGDTGNSYDTNVNANLAEADNGQTYGYYQIPTISVGFDGTPWYDSERALPISVSDFEESHSWVKNTYMPTYGTTGTWKDRAVWLSTWNEYGEGTYIMPSELNGFGYMDVLRNAYTDFDSSHEDLVPTESQLERITHKYPQYARKLWRQKSKSYPEPSLDYDFGGEKEYGKAESSVGLRDRTFMEKIFGSLPGHTGANFAFNSDKSINGTSTNSDPQVYVYDAKDIDVTDIDALRITMQIPEGQKAVVYFSTTGDTTLNSTKSTSVVATTSELTEYIFPFESNSAWTGKLNMIRIDPVTDEVGVNFYIKSVEFVKKSPVKLFINGIDCTSKVPYELDGDRVLFPFDPEASMHYHLYVLHTWDKEKGILKLEGNGHQVVYTVGKNTFVVDGVTDELGYTLTLSDGLPLIDVEQLALALDYDSGSEGSRVIIETPEYYMYEEMISDIESAEKGRWEFDTNDTLGFSAVNGIISVADGYMHIESNSSEIDIQATNLQTYDFDASEINQFELRARHDYSGYTTVSRDFKLYYITDQDTTWNEAKAIRGRLQGASSNGKWLTYTLSVENSVSDYSLWTGKITNIRFDPFDALGYMDIDYMRFTYNPNLIATDDNNEFENGNAEDNTNVSSYSTNGEVTIVEDAMCSGNLVYNVVPSDTSNEYLHFYKDFTFEENTEYKVTFLARAVPDDNGSITNMVLGCNMLIDSGIACPNLGLGTDGKWKMYEATFTTGTITDKENTKFRLYAEPVIKGSPLCAYQLDNITVTKVAES